MRSLIAGLLMVAIALAGCATTQTDFVARTPAPALQRVQPVKTPGTYMAMWTPSDKGHLLPLLGTDHFANKGDTLGFDRDPQGKLLTVFNDTREPIGPPPPKVKYVVWRHVRPAKAGVDFKAQPVIEAVGTAIIVAALVAVTIWCPGVWRDLLSDDDCGPDGQAAGRHHPHSGSKTGVPATPVR